MATKLLQKAFDPNSFKKEGHLLIELLAKHLEHSIFEEDKKTTHYLEPEIAYQFWKSTLSKTLSSEELFKKIIDTSIHVHNPNYMGHQVAPTAPLSALATLLSAQLNNGMAVYEMGQSATALERIVIEKFTHRIGWLAGDGFLTSGGTLANLTALLAARKAKAKNDVWTHGHGKKLAVLVSEQAHYCVDRAARIMGLGSDGIIKIPVDERYKMRTELLQKTYTQTTKKGYTIIAIIGSAPSTSTGIHDNLNAIGDFAKQHNLWFHIDGAHGGAALFSNAYSYLLNGIEKADSVIIDGHKMMATSSITTAVLFKNLKDSYTTFEQEASYLWEQQEDPEWYNLAKRTFECTKSMMSVRFIALWNAYGTAFFDDFVTTLYGLARTFADLLKSNKDFELFLEPESNIVCFRYIKNVEPQSYDQVNKVIRKQLLNDGTFYIVSTQLNGQFYLRTTFMNPFTTTDHMQKLLKTITDIAQNLN